MIPMLHISYWEMDIFVKSHAEISFPECFTDEDMMACRFFFTWETKPGINPLSVFLLDSGMSSADFLFDIHEIFNRFPKLDGTGFFVSGRACFLK